MQSHADTIRSAFTDQAEYISTSPAFLSQERLDLLLDLARGTNGLGPGKALAQSEMLDMACGAGIVANFMAGHVAQVTGIDLTPAVLEKAEALARESQTTNTRFLLGDVTAIPAPDASFDLVTCTSAFHHLDQPERVMAEVQRVLRPGGAFCAIDVTTSEVPWRREAHQQMERLRDPSHTSNLTPSAWRRLAQRGPVHKSEGGGSVCLWSVGDSDGAYLTTCKQTGPPPSELCTGPALPLASHWQQGFP